MIASQPSHSHCESSRQQMPHKWKSHHGRSQAPSLFWTQLQDQHIALLSQRARSQFASTSSRTLSRSRDDHDHNLLDDKKKRGGAESHVAADPNPRHGSPPRTSNRDAAHMAPRHSRKQRPRRARKKSATAATSTRGGCQTSKRNPTKSKQAANTIMVVPQHASFPSIIIH